MGALVKDSELQKEIRRLSLRIALVRYDLLEGLFLNKPLWVLSPVMQELSILQVQKYTLLTGHFEELPNHIKKLYNDNSSKKS